MEALEFKKALAEVLGSLEIKVDLTGTLSFNIKDTDLPPIDPSIVEPPIDPSIGPPIDPPIDPPIEPPDTSINVILENNFEHYTLGKWNIDEITADFWQHDPRLTIGGAYNNFVDVVNFNGTKCLRARMPYNANGTLSGFDIYSRLDPELKLEEVYVSYNLFFPNDFRSAHGGKLPGMTSLGMPGQIYEYNNDPYNPRSGNLVAGLYKGNHGPDEIKWYNFLKFPPANESPWGHMSPDGPYWTNTFGNGAWHNVTLRMVHSEASKYDGLCEVFIDGVLSDSWGDICTRIEPTQVWDDLRFQLFTNNSSEQTDSTNYYVYIDNLLLFNYDGNTDPDIPKGRVKSKPGRVLNIPNWPKT